MRLTHLLTNEVVVLRLNETVNNTMILSTVTSSMKCEIQPLSDEKANIESEVYGKTYVVYTDGRVSLYPGDTLRDRQGNKFTVKSGGVSIRQFGSIGYTKCIVELTQ
jgi:hypothetical protein